MQILDKSTLQYFWLKVKDMIKTTNIDVNKIYPIGSIYMSVNSVNPSTHFGGTWVAWGSGRVPVSINSSDTDFNTVEKTGGDKNLQSHTHTQASHTHTFSGTSHNHIQNSHEHTFPAHGHIIDLTSGSTTPGATGSTTPGATGSSGAHTHTVNYVSDATTTGGGTRVSGNGTSSSGMGMSSAGAHTHTSAAHTHTSAAHTHSVSGSTDATIVEVAVPSKQLTTATNQSATAEGTNSSSTPTINSAGSGSSQNLQPYITCYMWKRTA